MIEISINNIIARPNQTPHICRLFNLNVRQHQKSLQFANQPKPYDYNMRVLRVCDGWPVCIILACYNIRERTQGYDFAFRECNKYASRAPEPKFSITGGLRAHVDKQTHKDYNVLKSASDHRAFVLARACDCVDCEHDDDGAKTTSAQPRRRRHPCEHTLVSNVWIVWYSDGAHDHCMHTQKHILYVHTCLIT